MKIHMFIQKTLAKNQKHKLGNPKINQWDTQSNKFMMPDKCMNNKEHGTVQQR